MYFTLTNCNNSFPNYMKFLYLFCPVYFVYGVYLIYGFNFSFRRECLWFSYAVSLYSQSKLFVILHIQTCGNRWEGNSQTYYDLYSIFCLVLGMLKWLGDEKWDAHIIYYDVLKLKRVLEWGTLYTLFWNLVLFCDLNWEMMNG